jgi:phospholipid-binding lipoprotein MlaA
MKRVRLVCKLVFLMVLLLPFASHAEQDESALEGFNRASAKFNDKADAWVLKPVAEGYKKITPAPIVKGVSNFFSNLKELINIPNDLLQGKFKQAANDTGRLLMNSTFGLAGLLDPASTVGLTKSDGEDFGQTLAVWGLPEGPYIVLPLLGPSTLRALPSRYVEIAYLSPINNLEHVEAQNFIWGLELVNIRARLLESEKLISGDRYTFIKDAYLQRREFLVKDGDVEDDFGGGGYGEEGGYYSDEEF